VNGVDLQQLHAPNRREHAAARGRLGGRDEQALGREVQRARAARVELQSAAVVRSARRVAGDGATLARGTTALQRA